MPVPITGDTTRQAWQRGMASQIGSHFGPLGTVAGTLFGDRLFGGGDEESPPSRRRLARWQLFDQLMNPNGPVTQESPTETASLTALEQMSQRLAGGTGPEAETFGAGRNALLDVLRNAGSNFEDFFNTNIRDPAIRDFGQEILPTAESQLARSGYYGSAMGGEVGKATDELNRALIEGRSRTKLGAMGMQLAGAGMAPELAAPEIDTFMKLLGAGDYRRQKELDRIKLLMQLQSPSGSFADAGGAAGPSTGASLGSAAISALPALLMAVGACWVAEELYGYGLRLAMARFFVLTSDSPFIRAYRRYGRQWAVEVRHNRELRDRARKVWDRFVIEGARRWAAVRMQPR